VPGALPELGSSQHPENNLVSDSAYDDYDDDHVDTDFARAERLVATIYEALRADPELFARTMLVITYDEHGGLFDHVPPPTGVPSPGDPRHWTARLLHAIWHRRTGNFDFTMLGPRVPAVVVSPLIPAGTLDRRVHDHASVPATLRALFAPHAKPLTRRDAWATPFHDLATLDRPRTDLPDLSAYTQPPAPVDRQAGTEAVTVGTRSRAERGSAAASAVAVPTEQVPEYFWDFVNQADQVQNRLISVEEPEILAVPTSGTPDPEQAHEVTEAFAEAAHRHRHEGEPDSG